MEIMALRRETMLDMLKSAVAAYADIVKGALEILGLSSPEMEAGDKLTDTIIAGIATAILAGAAYVGREIFNALLAKIEERRKFKSAQVRYIFDAEIWMRDFAKKFCPEEAEKLLARLCDGPEDFRFSVASSKDSDSDEVMQFIHWLEATEIYRIRRFLTYGDLFDSMCDLISSESYSKIEADRKLTGLVKTIETGIDAYIYADASLATLSGGRGSVCWRYLRKLCYILLKLVVYEDRKYLLPPGEKQRKQHKGSDTPAHGWTDDRLRAFEAGAREKLKKALDERRKRLRHEQLLRLLPY